MNQSSHRDYSDQDFLEGLKNGELYPQLFNHEAHLRLAYLHLTENKEEIAVSKTCEIIKNYVTTLGLEQKFHLTLTVAAVKILNHFITKDKALDFWQLTKKYPILVEDFRSLLFAHYHEESLNNILAKERYVEPDKLPFD